jgi:ABC-type amino acid transport substrate-binding protein
LLALFLLAACQKQSVAPTSTEQAKQQEASPPSISSDGLPTASSSTVSLPMTFTRDTGDLDAMMKRRRIRALVILNPVGFFYDKGHPRGAMYETLAEFQKFVNKKLKTGKLPITITFLPMRSDQIEKALSEGLGDIVAYGVVVTPEREKNFAFSIPLMTDVKQIVVTRGDAGSISTLADLGGKEVYVNPITAYYQNLQTANETLKNSGKAPMVIKAADKNLTDKSQVASRSGHRQWTEYRLGHAQEQPTVEATGRRVCPNARRRNIVWEHSPSTLPAEHKMGEKLHFFRRTEEIPGERCPLPKVRR